MGGLAGEKTGLVGTTLIIDGLSIQRSRTFVTLDFFEDGSLSLPRITPTATGSYEVEASADGVHFLAMEGSPFDVTLSDYTMPSCQGPATRVKITPVAAAGGASHMRVCVYQYGDE